MTITPIEGLWYWVRVNGEWFPAKRSGGRWTNDDTWEALGIEIEEYRPIPLPDVTQTTYFEDVSDFHRKFDLPVDGALTTIPQRDFNFRLAFLNEELRELVEGHATGSLVQIADALADLVWVALGTACYFGIPFDRVWAEVRRSNMEKRPWREGDPIKPRQVMTVEVVKPDGWMPPDIRRALGL